MSILFNEKTKVFTLKTRNSTYQMKIGEYDVLLHLYYGRPLEDCDMSYLIQPADRGFSGNPYEAGKNRAFSLDTLPQEYPVFGTGDYRTSCLMTVNGDGSRAADLRYASHTIEPGKYSLKGLPGVYANDGDRADTLVITMKDRASGLLVHLYYGVMENLDIITRACRIQNQGKCGIQLERALSACLELPHNQLDFIHFYGKHAMEREMERVPAGHGTHVAGSVRGTSSHHHNPFVILCEKNATEDFGECYGLSFLYSGNFTAQVEVDQINQTRAVMGIHPDCFSYCLAPLEEFAAPEVVLAYTDQGLGQLSRIYHRAYRKNLCRGQYKEKPRPVLINNWEATYFDFTGDKLVEIAGAAAELGIEMLVMDDGWFGNRDGDHSGLGDWTVNEKKLGCSLKSLVDRVNEKGLKFGIWFEPEMVSEDSSLYRSHPDWALKIPGRDPNLSRYQLVLDFSREEVRSYIFDSMCRILDSANIEYVKWDMNRSLCDVYSNGLPGERQGEVSHRYVLGLYDFLEKITNRYPYILFEGCSGGGGRFDGGMLYYMPQIWCSDDTDAIERIKIQYGSSFGYPISSVGSHVSACPNHQTGRVTPLKTRGIVAMAGTFGYELDISRMTEEEKEMVKSQVKEYQHYNRLIQQGDYYRLTNPYEEKDFAAWEFVKEDKTEALLNCVSMKATANPAPQRIRLKGLCRDMEYEVNGKGAYSGAMLMYGGLPLPVPRREYDSIQFYISKK